MKTIHTAPFVTRMASLASIVVLAGAMVLGPMPAMAKGEGGALEGVAVTEKLIRIRNAEDDGGTVGPAKPRGLRVDLRTARATYRKGEAIRFQVRGNRPFFLYLLNIDTRSGKAVAILPNRLQTDENIKYPGDNRWHVVPNERLEFYSDRVGKERIIMIATDRYLDVDELLRESNGKARGDFYTLEAPFDGIDNAIGSSYGDKSIRIRGGEKGNRGDDRLPPGVVIKEMNLRIR